MANRIKSSAAAAVGAHSRTRQAKRLAIVACLGLLMGGGCARYEYRLVEPAEHAQTLSKTPTRLNLPPIDYHLATRDKRLVIGIYNPTDAPVTLVGSKSYVVDPQGQTHPLVGGTIAPNSYTSLALPPALPGYRVQPSFSFGLGYGGFWPYHGYAPFFGTGFGYGYDPFYAAGPYTVYPLNPPHYWEWKTGLVRLRLLYESNGLTNAADHRFVFERRRVD